MTLTKAEITKFTNIVNKMDTEDSKILIQIWKNAQNMKSANQAAQFQKGNLVQFTSRTGEVITGTVSKVNRKSIAVETTKGSWKVSPSLLTLID